MRSLLLRVRGMSLRTRWVLTIAVYALVAVAVVIALRSGGGGGNGGSSQAEAAAVAEANREGRIAIAQDEAPHSSVLALDLPARVALERAVGVDVRARIAHGELTGPLQSVRCAPAAADHAGRRQLSCTVISAGISYPFVGVADPSTRRLTWCKEDPPPVMNAPLEVPVSPRCRA